MFILMFTRLTDGEGESILLVGTFDTLAAAQKRMRSEWETRINEMDWDPDWSWFEEKQAFCGTEDMFDTCRFYIFDTENKYGFSNSINDEMERKDW